MQECSTCGHVCCGSSLSVAGPPATAYGEGGPAIAATKTFAGSGLSALSRSMTSATLSNVPSSAETQVPRSLCVVTARGGFAPPQRCPSSLQRYDAKGPSGSLRNLDVG